MLKINHVRPRPGVGLSHIHLRSVGRGVYDSPARRGSLLERFVRKQHRVFIPKNPMPLDPKPKTLNGIRPATDTCRGSGVPPHVRVPSMSSYLANHDQMLGGRAPCDRPVWNTQGALNHPVRKGVRWRRTARRHEPGALTACGGGVFGAVRRADMADNNSWPMRQDELECPKGVEMAMRKDEFAGGQPG